LRTIGAAQLGGAETDMPLRRSQRHFFVPSLARSKPKREAGNETDGGGVSGKQTAPGAGQQDGRQAQ
jgi:hypothetical protein